MSNSPLVTYTRYASHYYGKRTHEIDTITIHHAAGINATVEGIGSIFANPDNWASSNYGVDGTGNITLYVDEENVPMGRVGLYVDEDNAPMTSSNRANDERAVTLEVANSAGWPDWPVSEAAFNAVIELCADICRRNGRRRMVWIEDRAARIAYEPREGEMRMTVHRDFAATSCPGNYLYDRMGLIANLVNRKLEAMEDEEMTGEEINRRLDEYWHGLPTSDYAREACKKGVESGIFKDGDNDGLVDDPCAPLRRQDLAVVLDRLGLLGSAKLLEDIAYRMTRMEAMLGTQSAKEDDRK